MALVGKLTRQDGPDNYPKSFFIDDDVYIGSFYNKSGTYDENIRLRVPWDYFLSDRHAVISYPASDDWFFQIRDLNSTNGTKVNGGKIPSDVLHPLKHGDSIELGITRFQFEIFRVNNAYCHGLMVAHNGKDLKGPEEDARALKFELGLRGFAGNISELYNAGATRENITRVLNEVKERSLDESIFVFFYSGHATKWRTLHLGSEEFGARELFSALAKIRGQILIVLDGCYTNSFSYETMPERSVLIGHRSAAYEESKEPVRPRNIMINPESLASRRAQYLPVARGYTTKAMIDALKQQKGLFDVRELVHEIQKDTRITAKHQMISGHHKTELFLPAKTNVNGLAV